MPKIKTPLVNIEREFAEAKEYFAKNPTKDKFRSSSGVSFLLTNIYEPNAQDGEASKKLLHAQIKVVGAGNFGKGEQYIDETMRVLFIKKSAKVPQESTSTSIDSDEDIVQQLESEDDASKKQLIASAMHTTKDGQKRKILVMDYVEGIETWSSLAAVDPEDGSYNIKTTMLPKIFIFMVALSEVQTLKNTHASNILHCDIKPQNIMLDISNIKDFMVKSRLVDWGLAKKLAPGETMIHDVANGTKSYAAPEILESAKSQKLAPYTVASDVYSLGATFVNFLYLTTGRNRRLNALVDRMKSDSPNARPSLDELEQALKSEISHRMQAEPLRPQYISLIINTTNIFNLMYNAAQAIKTLKDDIADNDNNNISKFYTILDEGYDNVWDNMRELGDEIEKDKPDPDKIMQIMQDTMASLDQTRKSILEYLYVPKYELIPYDTKDALEYDKIQFNKQTGEYAMLYQGYEVRGSINPEKYDPALSDADLVKQVCAAIEKDENAIQSLKNHDPKLKFSLFMNTSSCQKKIASLFDGLESYAAELQENKTELNSEYSKSNSALVEEQAKFSELYTNNDTSPSSDLQNDQSVSETEKIYSLGGYVADSKASKAEASTSDLNDEYMTHEAETNKSDLNKEYDKLSTTSASDKTPGEQKGSPGIMSLYTTFKASEKKNNQRDGSEADQNAATQRIQPSKDHDLKHDTYKPKK